MKKIPSEKYPKLKERFEDLEQLKKDHVEIAYEFIKVAEGNMFITDFVFLAFLKRSLDILEGIKCLTNQWNFIAATPLLRLQLDNLLRLVYIMKLEDPDKISQVIWKGNSFRKIKDSNGKKLTDSRLCSHAKEYYPRIDDVYNKTSKFIHFSNEHIKAIIQNFDKDEGIINFFVGAGNENWPEEDISDFLDSTIFITKEILTIISERGISKENAYRDYKRNKEND